MRTRAVRLYGKDDVRIEEFSLPPCNADEILARVVTNSVCMSDYKAVKQGSDHTRIPPNIAQTPIIIGHEFCGEIVEVGSKWTSSYKVGDRFSIQPALHYNGSSAALGYSYPWIGGNATYIIIPNEVMELDCLLIYEGEAFFLGSLAEPISCIVGAYHAMYHTQEGSYVHTMGIVAGGNMAILAGAGPMGLGAIDYGLHCDRRPSLMVVTDIDEARLTRAASLYTVQEAAKQGVSLVYLHTKDLSDPIAKLNELSGGEGFNDVFIMAAAQTLVEQADAILARDGCINFFAGPTRTDFKAMINFYNVHYTSTHIVGTSGGNTDDMRESLLMMEEGLLNPASMITHIGGLNAVPQTIIKLPSISGGKKLIYTHMDLPLTAIVDFTEKGLKDPLFAVLAEITARHKGLWNVEAETYLLENGPLHNG